MSGINSIIANKRTKTSKDGNAEIIVLCTDTTMPEDCKDESGKGGFSAEAKRLITDQFNPRGYNGDVAWSTVAVATNGGDPNEPIRVVYNYILTLSKDGANVSPDEMRSFAKTCADQDINDRWWAHLRNARMTHEQTAAATAPEALTTCPTGEYLIKVLGNTLTPTVFVQNLFNGQPLKNRPVKRKRYHISLIPKKNDWGAGTYAIRGETGDSFSPAQQSDYETYRDVKKNDFAGQTSVTYGHSTLHPPHFDCMSGYCLGLTFFVGKMSDYNATNFSDIKISQLVPKKLK